MNSLASKRFSLIPGRKKLNLHASYAVFGEGEWVDRDCLQPEHFKVWVDYAKKRGIGIDFNGTFFSHRYAEQFTLSSNDERIRQFWVRHGQACIKIAEYFAEELGEPCLLNIWIPDGYKDIPADRLGPRMRLTQSLDEILSVDHDKEKVYCMNIEYDFIPFLYLEEPDQDGIFVQCAGGFSSIYVYAGGERAVMRAVYLDVCRRLSYT